MQEVDERDIAMTSSSEEDEGELDEESEAQFLETLMKVKKRDRSIYEEGAQLPSPKKQAKPSSKEAGGEGKKKQVKLLKDVLLEQAETDSEEEDERTRKRKQRAYDQEQEELRRAFVQSAKEVDSNAGDGTEEFGGLVLKQSLAPAPAPSKRTAELLENVFGGDGKLSEEDKFLKEYFQRQEWTKVDTEEAADLSMDDEEDEEELEQSEKFEARYNFRFEEPGAAQLLNYPRNPEHVVRKQEEGRKKQRKNKAARQAGEAKLLQEKQKQERNIVKQEIQERLNSLKAAAGSNTIEQDLLSKVLEEDFDPDTYDHTLAQLFGDKFYDEEDLGGDLEVSDPELDDAPVDAQEQELVAEEAPRKRKKKGKTTSSPDKTSKEVLELLEKYQEAGNAASGGFTYKAVPKADYGLSVEEILNLSDKELNKMVSMKKLAAYRADAASAKADRWRHKIASKGKGAKKAKQKSSEAEARLQSFKKPQLHRKQ